MRRSIRLVSVAVAGLGLGNLFGCAGFDEIGSRRFKEEPFTTLFVADDPMTILRSSGEADRRVKAMRNVKEPIASGGSQADQDELIGILSNTASTDIQGVCRLAAIDTLARMRDPRAGEVLIKVWATAAPTPPEPTTKQGVAQASLTRQLPGLPFAPEVTIAVQGRTLEAIGQKQSPEGLPILIQLAEAPIKKKERTIEMDILGSGGDDQSQFELRLSAIRGLSYYQSEPKAIECLIRILQTEKDVAIRGRTQASLVKITGQTFAADYELWLKWWQAGGTVNTEPPSLIQQIGGWFGSE